MYILGCFCYFFMNKQSAKNERINKNTNEKLKSTHGHGHRKLLQVVNNKQQQWASVFNIKFYL